MYTVKVIDSEGNENIMDARSVTAKASERKTSNEPFAIVSVFFQTSDGAEIDVSGQGATVYVMNDSGKTVSKYFLGENKGVTSNN